MRNKVGDTARLYEIVMYCERIAKAVIAFEGRYDKFIDNDHERDCDACAFYIGQIGKFVNKLSKEFRAEHSEVDWREIVSLRNSIVHAYKSVRKNRIWNVMRNKIPLLNTTCRRLLFELDPTAEADLREELGETIDAGDQTNPET